MQEFLSSVELFRELDDEELAQVLMIGVVRSYAEGTSILTEGSAGGHIHVIHQGQVRISKVVPGSGEEALTILKPSELFGEVEFFDSLPASAHAIAHTPCELFSIPHTELRSLMEARPELGARFLWAFCRILAARLRETNHRMASLFAISRAF